MVGEGGVSKYQQLFAQDLAQCSLEIFLPKFPFELARVACQTSLDFKDSNTMELSAYLVIMVKKET